MLDERRSIVDIHTRSWSPPLSSRFKDELASLSVGFTGADIESWCVQASMAALRRRYPQIYSSKAKLQIEEREVVVTAHDFALAKDSIVPTVLRSGTSHAAALPRHIAPRGAPRVRTKLQKTMQRL